MNLINPKLLPKLFSKLELKNVFINKKNQNTIKAINILCLKKEKFFVLIVSIIKIIAIRITEPLINKEPLNRKTGNRAIKEIARMFSNRSFSNILNNFIYIYFLLK